MFQLRTILPMNIVPAPGTSLSCCSPVSPSTFLNRKIMKAQQLLAAIISAFCLLPSAFGQGALTPPGAPVPTMKSLDQVEARTPVDATHTPGDSQNDFIISRPGSYYLTGNITGVAGKNGIWIATNDVNLDLNGFSINGVPGFEDGIQGFNLANIAIRNGLVRNWGNDGINCGVRVTNCTVENIRAYNNGDGIDLGSCGTITHCVATANVDDGIVC